MPAGNSIEVEHLTRKFKKVGKYRFYCTVHPDVMRMKVVVHR